MIRFLQIFLFSILVVSCKTKQIESIMPPAIVETQPSWDGEKQNSGLIGYVDGKGFEITRKAGERYKALTEKFGKQLSPVIYPGEGLEVFGENYILSAEYMSVFMEVSRLNKQ